MLYQTTHPFKSRHENWLFKIVPGQLAVNGEGVNSLEDLGHCHGPDGRQADGQHVCDVVKGLNGRKLEVELEHEDFGEWNGENFETGWFDD